MQRRTLISLLSIALLAAMVFAPAAEAQRGGGPGGQDGQGGRGPGGGGRSPFGGGFNRGRGGGGGGGGTDIMGLLRIDKVRGEIKVTEDQQELVQILGDELREGRPDFPANFRDLSEDERGAVMEKMRKWNEEQAAVAKDTLKAILEPPQYTRLTQISIQTQGLNALLDPDVIKALAITDEQKEQLETTREANQEARGAAFREMLDNGGGGGPGGFDREAMAEKNEALRKEGDAKLLAHLTADQKTAFEALKGDPFEMPERTFRGGRGGRGGRGPGGDGGRPRRPGGEGGGRPQRPE